MRMEFEPPFLGNNMDLVFLPIYHGFSSITTRRGSGRKRLCSGGIWQKVKILQSLLEGRRSCLGLIRILFLDQVHLLLNADHKFLHGLLGCCNAFIKAFFTKLISVPAWHPVVHFPVGCQACEVIVSGASNKNHCRGSKVDALKDAAGGSSKRVAPLTCYGKIYPLDRITHFAGHDMSLYP